MRRPRTCGSEGDAPLSLPTLPSSRRCTVTRRRVAFFALFETTRRMLRRRVRVGGGVGGGGCETLVSERQERALVTPRLEREGEQTNGPKHKPAWVVMCMRVNSTPRTSQASPRDARGLARGSCGAMGRYDQAAAPHTRVDARSFTFNGRRNGTRRGKFIHGTRSVPFLQGFGTSQHRMKRHDQSRLACVGRGLCVQPTAIPPYHAIRVAR